MVFAHNLASAGSAGKRLRNGGSWATLLAYALRLQGQELRQRCSSANAVAGLPY